MTAPLPVTPSFRLDGKRALVTGAGRGLGRALATALAGGGAHVVLVSRTIDEVAALAADLVAAGHSATARVLDVTQTTDVALAVAADMPLDILVNNAGTNRPMPLTETTEADYDAVTDLNVRAAFFASKAFAASLIAAGRPGTIINISSQMGHVGAANRTVYCATKFALEGMTKAMAIELAPHAIRVNSLCPTFVETPMTAPMLARADFRAEVLSKIPLGRLARVEDVMGAVVFLASDAAAMVTGAALLVDGGWTAA